MTLCDVTRPGEQTGWRAQTQATFLGVVFRYGLSTSGPLAVSAAHFLASLIFLRNLPAQEFGLFSFVMVVVSFGMSLAAALVIAPLTQSLILGAHIRPTCYRINVLGCSGFGLFLFLALWVSHAPLLEAATLGLYGTVFTWRWVARNIAYIDGRPRRAILSDLSYSLMLVIALAALALFHRFSFTAGADMMLLSALAALVPFGHDFLTEQLAALQSLEVKSYLPMFRDVSLWSLTGVAVSEVTANAHAYLVTFISGPSSFALLALGTLMMRPGALVQSALPDLERPSMARAIAAHDLPLLARIRRQFTAGLGGAWLLNILLCTGLLLWAPQLLLKKGYSVHDVSIVVALSAAILALRGLRMPLAVMLQAAGKFRALALMGSWSGLVSAGLALALLLAFGPKASLLGILAGEAVVLWRCRMMARRWEADHA